MLHFFVRTVFNLVATGMLVASVLPAATPAGNLEPGYRMMYNLQFGEAHGFFAEWQRAHPEDPMGPVSDAAAFLFTEFDRLHILESELFTNDDKFVTRNKPKPDPVVKRQFDNALERGGYLAERVLARSPMDKDALFAMLLRYGLRSDYIGLVERRYMASLSEMKRGRRYAERLLALDSAYYDAYVAIGVENYMLSLKPAPVRWLLRLGGAQTDREQGIAKLRLAAAKGRYLLPFARLLLAVVALRDKDKDGARLILRQLAVEFPKNRLYAQELARLN
jgi:hypothetical protein